MEILINYVNLVILIVCLSFGYVLKNALPSKKINKYIPLFEMALGIVLSAWQYKAFSIDILAIGCVSGLFSVGCYELFKNTIEKPIKDFKDSKKV